MMNKIMLKREHVWSKDFSWIIKGQMSALFQKIKLVKNHSAAFEIWGPLGGLKIFGGYDVHASVLVVLHNGMACPCWGDGGVLY